MFPITLIPGVIAEQRNPVLFLFLSVHSPADFDDQVVSLALTGHSPPDLAYRPQSAVPSSPPKSGQSVPHSGLKYPKFSGQRLSLIHI